MLALNKMAGIEVDGSRWHFAVVEKRIRGFAVTHAMTLDDVNRRDPLSLRPAIDEFYRRARIDKSRTVLALPRSAVVLRVLKFPAAVHENLDNIIDYQVENYEPIDRAELSYAHQRLENGGRKKSRGASGKLEVLLVMARRADIETYQKKLQQLDLHLRAVLCGSLGLAQLMRLNDTSSRENHFLIRRADSGFELLALCAGKLECARRYDGDATPEGFQKLFQEFERVQAELRLEAKDIHNVFVLSAEGDSMLASMRQLAPSLPWHPLRAPASLENRLPAADFAPSAAAIGVALSAMVKEGLATDLVDHGERVAPARWMWAPTYALCAVALVMVGAGTVTPYFQQRKFIAQLNAEIARLQPHVRQVERLETDVDAIQKKASVLEALRAHDARTLEALRELSAILPDSVWINELNLRADGVEISGFADNTTALIPLLEQSSVFQDAALASGITRNQQGKEMFHIRMKFKY